MEAAERADMDEEDEDAILDAIQTDSFEVNVEHGLDQEDQE